MTIIEERTPVAKKQYTCDLCGCKIEPGQKYKVQKNADGGCIQNFQCHIECDNYALKTLFYCRFYDRLTKDNFRAEVGEHIHEKFYDDELDDIPMDIAELSKYEQVKLLLNNSHAN